MTRVLDGSDAFLDQLGAVDVGPLLLAICCHLLKMACTTRAWRNVLAAAPPAATGPWRQGDAPAPAGAGVACGEVSAASGAGVGVNAIVPARAGDAVRIYLVHRAVPSSTY